MFCYYATSAEAFGPRAEGRQIRISDSDTNKMDGLIPFTKPIREDKPRAWFEAMEVDAMDQQGTGDSDSIEEKCKCTALQASGRGGACYYCTKEGHFLRSCLRKAAGLLRSTPTKEEQGAAAERSGSGTIRPANRRPRGSGARVLRRATTGRHRRGISVRVGGRVWIGGTSPGETAEGELLNHWRKALLTRRRPRQKHCTEPSRMKKTGCLGCGRWGNFGQKRRTLPSQTAMRRRKWVAQMLEECTC